MAYGGRLPAARRATRVVLTDVLVAFQQTALACLSGMVLVAVVPALWGWTTTVVVSDSMGPTIHAGDVISASPRSPREAERVPVGRVVLVKNPAQPDELLLHRLIAYRAQNEMILKGDANAVADSTPVPPDHLRGVAQLRVPFVGLPYLWLQQGRYLPALAATVLVFALILWRPRTRGPSPTATSEPADVPPAEHAKATEPARAAEATEPSRATEATEPGTATEATEASEAGDTSEASDTSEAAEAGRPAKPASNRRARRAHRSRRARRTRRN